MSNRPEYPRTKLEETRMNDQNAEAVPGESWWVTIVGCLMFAAWVALAFAVG